MARKFNIIKKKDLPDEASIVGFSFLKPPTNKNIENKQYDFVKKSNNNEIACMKTKRRSVLTYTKGYVQIDDNANVFVEVKSRLLVVIILIMCIGVILTFPSFSRGDSLAMDDLPIIGNIDIFDNQQNRPVETTPKTEAPTITFAGYGKYTVNEECPSVELKNPDVNFVDMVFTLTDQDTGEIIARTGKVPAGKYAYVDVVDFYKAPGVYTVLINVATFDAESGAQMNGVNQKMEVTVENKDN